MVNLRNECYQIYQILYAYAMSSSVPSGFLGKRKMPETLGNFLQGMFPGYEAIVFLDTETTGLNPQKDRIIQLSAVRANLEEGSCSFYDALIRLPYGEHLPEGITQLTGITDQKLSNFGFHETEVLEDFQKMLDGKRILMAGHNLQFDLCFLMGALKREEKSGILAMIDAADYLDTLTIYRDRRPSPHKLSAALQEYDFPSLSAHNAILDACAVMSLTCMMGYELADLNGYINVFGIDPRYGLFGNEIKKVTYISQDGSSPPPPKRKQNKSR